RVGGTSRPKRRGDWYDSADTRVGGLGQSYFRSIGLVDATQANFYVRQPDSTGTDCQTLDRDPATSGGRGKQMGNRPDRPDRDLTQRQTMPVRGSTTECQHHADGSGGGQEDRAQDSLPNPEVTRPGVAPSSQKGTEVPHSWLRWATSPASTGWSATPRDEGSAVETESHSGHPLGESVAAAHPDRGGQRKPNLWRAGSASPPGWKWLRPRARHVRREPPRAGIAGKLADPRHARHRQPAPGGSSTSRPPGRARIASRVEQF